MASPSTPPAHPLLALLSALTTNITALLRTTPTFDGNVFHARPSALDSPSHLPSPTAFALVERLRADLRALDAALTPSRLKLAELAFAPLKAAALDVALRVGVADRLAGAEGGRLGLEELAGEGGVNANKLGRALRILAAETVFVEVAPEVFANTRHSLGLCAAEGAGPMLSLIVNEGAHSALGLADHLLSPTTRDAFDAHSAPFCATVAPHGESFEEYLADPAHAETAEKVVQGVVPWLNRITRAQLVHDYPWATLGSATVVDVGCGPGDAAVDILRTYPDLRWIFQDLPAVVVETEKAVTASLPAHAAAGKISFVAQDFLQPNASADEGDVFFMRGIMRDSTDAQAHTILTHLRDAFVQRKRARPEAPPGRILINEIICGPPWVIPIPPYSSSSPNPSSSSDPSSSSEAPIIPSAHIPPSQSALADAANLMAQSSVNFFGGVERGEVERGEAELRRVVEGAGLVVRRFWRLRTFTAVVECGLAE